MPRESFAQKAARSKIVLEAFKKAYPDAHCELGHSTPLQLLVATILSAQCTDKRVNMVTPGLFKKYLTAKDFADARQEVLEQEIKSTGFFRNKAKSIRACCKGLLERHGSEVPRTMEELTALEGVGRKTANVVLGNAFNMNVGVVVDTHVGRLAKRLGFSREAHPEKIEQDLMKLIPREDWSLISHLLIFHGRQRCIARKPDCPGCEVLALCPRIGVPGPKPAPRKP